jgi:hypothetical protein
MEWYDWVFVACGASMVLGSAYLIGGGYVLIRAHLRDRRPPPR